jgi:hypothetical protein
LCRALTLRFTMSGTRALTRRTTVACCTVRRMLAVGGASTDRRRIA